MSEQAIPNPEAVPPDESADDFFSNITVDKETNWTEPLTPNYKNGRAPWWERLRETVFPPKKEGKRERKPRARKPPVKKVKEGFFVEPLTQVYGYVGMMVMIRDQSCGKAIMESGRECAIALDKWAQENDTIRSMLLVLTQSSTIGLVIMAHLPILMAVMSHHGPESFSPLMGMNPPPKAPTDAQFASPNGQFTKPAASYNVPSNSVVFPE